MHSDLIDAKLAVALSLQLHCSQVGPHLRDPVPMGTFFSFGSPLGPHFSSKVPIFSI